MTEEQRAARNNAMLQECYFPFALKVRAILKDLEGAGWHPRILQAARSPQEQRIAYNTGHSKLLFGFHNITDSHGKPAACAVDMIDESDPNAEKSPFFLALLSAARAHELTTGGLWGLTSRQITIVNDAVSKHDWLSGVRMGWDAGHVEYPGRKPYELQAEVRGEK